MKRRCCQTGFTLVETLLAMTIIVTILAAVYGSYFAVSGSAGAYKRRLALDRRQQILLADIARQIRCAYVPMANESNDMASSARQTARQQEIDCFTGGRGTGDDTALHLLSTSRFPTDHLPQDGVFEVDYKFDRNTGQLLLNQRRYCGRRPEAQGNWRRIAEGLKSIEFEFSDEDRWRPAWSFAESRRLPKAVRVTITCLDDKNVARSSRIVAPVFCAIQEETEHVITPDKK